MKKEKLSSFNPVLSLLEGSLASLPTPSSISYLWNFGFLLGMVLVLQIVTGSFLAMNYIPHTTLAFDSVVHIMRDIDSGYLVRYAHMNGASLFFAAIYTHMGRGIYFSSPKKMPMVWFSGILILLCTMGAAFVGYVLPWGQMSFWGATVITSMLSALPYVGGSLTNWLWGGFSVDQPTLDRFFSLHFLLPMVIVLLVVFHLILLHQTGSSNPMGLSPDLEKTKFFPLFMVKDLVPLVFLTLLLLSLISLSPEALGDVENLNVASSSTTPPHIQPEWYFLFAYAILRSIPSKLGGVVAMAGSILVVSALAFKSFSFSSKFSPQKKTFFWGFITVVLLLTWVGANPVEPPFVGVGQVLTMSYFSFFLVL